MKIKLKSTTPIMNLLAFLIKTTSRYYKDTPFDEQFLSLLKAKVRKIYSK